MKNLLTILATTILASHHTPQHSSIFVSAVPANPLSFSQQQPDGTSISLTQRGDGSYSYLSDEGGYKVLKDEETGWFVYAEESDDDLNHDHNSSSSTNSGDSIRRRRLSKPSNHRVGTVDPASLYLPKGHVDVPPLHERRTAELQNDTAELTHRRMVNTKGTFHNLVLLIQFSDHTSRSLPPQGHYDRLYNMVGTHSTIAPTGSVKQVYLDNSNGMFEVESTVYKWITVGETEAYYANGNNGFTKLKEAILEALEVLENDPSINFADFDMDNDGSIDGFGILHSGYGAEFGGDDCYGQTNENRIWSHKGGIDWVSKEEGIKVSRYYVSSALRGKCGNDIVRMGVICHELGHYLGLPDLYDISFEGTGIGAYDMMSQSWGFDGSGMYPPYLSAWSKVQVGWVDPILITKNGVYNIEASSLNGGQVYRIDEGFPEGEYLLIENRQPNGFDGKLPQGGIAIWHIDDNAEAQRNRGYPQQDGWPSNGNHYEVALLSSDGKYDMELGSNQGDASDLWHATSPKRELKAGGGLIFPNTDSYQGGVVAKTGITISGFSPSRNLMTFSVSGFKTTDAPTSNPTPLATARPSNQPVSSRPSRSPVATRTQPPSKAPITPSPTVSPVESDQCANLCLEPLSASECPSSIVFPNCPFAVVGGLCDADGECGTDQYLNNCYGYDIYRRVECTALSDTMTNWNTPVELSGDMDTMVADLVVSTEPTPQKTRRPISPPSSRSPTQKPSVLTITGAGLASHQAGIDQCLFYPGWHKSLSYCLNDCDKPKPTYMMNNPIFEFPDIESCCRLHYRAGDECKAQSKAASSQSFTPEAIDTTESSTPKAIETALAIVNGHVWNDFNGNDWRDASEVGLQGVTIDLFECAGDNWIKGTRTSSDGSYRFEFQPGKYYLKITPPIGSHLSNDHPWRNGDLDSDFGEYTETTSCHDFVAGSDNTRLDAGVIPDTIAEEVYLAPEAAEEEQLHYQEKSSGNTVLAMSHSAAHSKTSRTSPSAPVDTSSVASLHAKSFLRGADLASTDPTVVTVQAVGDATIESQQDIMFIGGKETLRVGRQSTWKDEFLVKFDVNFLDGKQAQAAKLRLYSLSSSPAGGMVRVAAHNSWDEDTVTWSNAPESGDVLDVVGPTRPNEWIEVDVTAALALSQNGYVSLRITSSTTNHSWPAKYSSKEGGASLTPQLRVYF
mmetsp:Transcript_22446/g.48834  ORF Transcript_22446/g.48834 Transcript_22446/m.48834 type:complete len:1184 (-) Transcript_22446:70-3621(-)